VADNSKKETINLIRRDGLKEKCILIGWDEKERLIKGSQSFKVILKFAVMIA